MTIRIRVSTTIDAPPAQVWDVIEPVERHVDWMADAVRITFRGEGHRGVGTRFECLTRVGPVTTTDVMTITEWRPRESMGIEHEGVISGAGRFTLRRKRRGRTKFGWDERLRFPWWMGGVVGERAAWPLLRRMWRANLIRLKHEVESGR